MSIYNFSSTDSAHYNRICVNLPNHFNTQYVQLAVTTFTSNCNIEVMNGNDYIAFLIDGLTYKPYMKTHSKLTAASLPYILQEILNEYSVPITVSITNVDTIRFTCDKRFAITDMSYNMKLITGYYCKGAALFPVESTEFVDKQPTITVKNKDLTDIQFNALNLRVGDYLPIDKTITPPDAHGYSISYTSSDEKIASIDKNGYVSGISVGEVIITAEVRNPNTSQFVKPDFTKQISIKVVMSQETKIDSVEVPDSVTIYETQDYTIYPKVSPVQAIYTETWRSADPDIAIVANGYIRAIKAGQTTIEYRLVNKYTEEQIFNKSIAVTVKSQYESITKHEIVSDTVGYLLSTPILYLLTNIGNHVFFNEISDQNKLQCGTVCMCLNNSYSSSFPIVAQQADIITKCSVNHTSNVWFILVDANMHEIRLLNPMYITVMVRPDDVQIADPFHALAREAGIK